MRDIQVSEAEYRLLSILRAQGGVLCEDGASAQGQVMRCCLNPECNAEFEVPGDASRARFCPGCRTALPPAQKIRIVRSALQGGLGEKVCINPDCQAAFLALGHGVRSVFCPECRKLPLPAKQKIRYHLERGYADRVKGRIRPRRRQADTERKPVTERQADTERKPGRTRADGPGGKGESVEGFGQGDGFVEHGGRQYLWSETKRWKCLKCGKPMAPRSPEEHLCAFCAMKEGSA